MVAHAHHRAVVAAVRLAAVIAVGAGVTGRARLAVGAGFPVGAWLAVRTRLALGARLAAVGFTGHAVFAGPVFVRLRRGFRRHNSDLGLDFDRRHVADRLSRGFAAMVADGAVAVAALAALRAAFAR
jgi:hypothetical protein